MEVGYRVRSRRRGCQVWGVWVRGVGTLGVGKAQVAGVLAEGSRLRVGLRGVGWIGAAV